MTNPLFCHMQYYATSCTLMHGNNLNTINFLLEERESRDGFKEYYKESLRTKDGLSSAFCAVENMIQTASEDAI